MRFSALFNTNFSVGDWTEEIWGLWRGIESFARVNREDRQEVHRVDDGLQLVELGRQREAGKGRYSCEEEDHLPYVVLYSSGCTSWGLLSFRRSASGCRISRVTVIVSLLLLLPLLFCQVSCTAVYS